MTEVADHPAKPVDRQDRCLYVWWGVSLALLALLGTFCWTVVVPVWRARRVLRKCDIVTRIPDGSPITFDENEVIRCLGGPEYAGRSIGLYVRASGLLRPDADDPETDDRLEAVLVLKACGRAGLAALESLKDDYDPDIRQAAAEALKKIRGEETEG